MARVASQFQQQQNGYYCGPAATRVALTARNHYPSQDQVAKSLGTTVNGTDSSNNVVNTLNAYLGGGTYEATFIGGNDATPAQRDELLKDVRYTIDSGYVVVANVVGPISTNDSSFYSYPTGHYVAIIGYEGDNVLVADVNVREYWVTGARMATWIAGRSYSSKVGGPEKPVVSSETIYLIDLASYQAGINLHAAVAAGVEAVNVKTSEGMGYTWHDAGKYVAEAKSLGLRVSTFHWIDSTGPGKAQAQRAFELLKQANGGTSEGIAHQCDCEDDAPFGVVQDYINEFQRLLGRPIIFYTGDWWLPGDWNVANLTPYLWAAPNIGYLGVYPGDDSIHWRAGYGGYDYLSAMQFAVSPIQGSGVGDVSKTRVRTEVWNVLAGTSPAEEDLTEEEDDDMAAKPLYLAMDQSSIVVVCAGDNGIFYQNIGDGNTVHTWNSIGVPGPVVVGNVGSLGFGPSAPVGADSVVVNVSADADVEALATKLLQHLPVGDNGISFDEMKDAVKLALREGSGLPM
jgi:hypothetical protein